MQMPEDSWVARYNDLQNLKVGVYAINVYESQKYRREYEKIDKKSDNTEEESP